MPIWRRHPGIYFCRASNCRSPNRWATGKQSQQRQAPEDLKLAMHTHITTTTKTIRNKDRFVLFALKNLPRMEKKTAPTKPMKGSSLGTAAAMPPKVNTTPVRNIIWQRLWFSLRTRVSILRQSMSIGTYNCNAKVKKIAQPIRICAICPDLEFQQRYNI